MEEKNELKVWQSRYENKKQELLKDDTICPENIKLFSEFLDGHEYKLKRTNGLRSIDSSTYKTLYGYTQKLSIS